MLKVRAERIGRSGSPIMRGDVPRMHRSWSIAVCKRISKLECMYFWCEVVGTVGCHGDMRGVAQGEKRGRNGTLSIGSLIRSARGIRTARRQGVGASLSSVKCPVNRRATEGGTANSGQRATDNNNTGGGGGNSNNNREINNNNSMAGEVGR